VRLDGIAYNHVPLDKIPGSYAKAPIEFERWLYGEDSTELFAVAGNIGVKRTISSPMVEGGNPQVLAEPMSSWFMYRRDEFEPENTYFDSPGLDGFNSLTDAKQCPRN
jgi:hypothetical protein